MKSIRKLVLAALATLAFAGGAAAYNEALMTIRFNTPRVSYEEQLFNVVSEAVRTKSTVIFDVVSTSPAGVANIEGQRVAQDIIRIGVNPAQVMYHAEQSQAVGSEEVRIFVR